MGDPGRIPPLSVRAAALRLGRTEPAVRDLVKTEKLTPVVRTPSVKLAVRDVEQLRQARQRAAIDEYVARDVDLLKLARDVRRQLRPLVSDPVRGGEAALNRLPVRTRDFFGPATLQALAMGDPARCSWCEARFLSRKFGVPEPVWDQVTLGLLGSPCVERCMPRFAGPEMARLRARVGGVSTRPSAPRTAPVAAAGSKAPPAPPVPRRTAALPVQDDGGKSMVASALRTARGRLKSAKRAGDQRYALQLAQTIRALEADAAAVDGPLAAAARPGRLRCGHLLSAGCACPRRASSRGQR